MKLITFPATREVIATLESGDEVWLTSQGRKITPKVRFAGNPVRFRLNRFFSDVWWYFGQEEFVWWYREPLGNLFAGQEVVIQNIEEK